MNVSGTCPGTPAPPLDRGQRCLPVARESPRLALSFVRSTLLVLLCALPALAGPSVPTDSAGTLGRPDLASQTRVVALVPLSPRQVLAVDAAGLARLWDVGDWQQLGVASAGTRVVVGPSGLEPPRSADGGCSIAAPVAVTSSGMLLTAEGQALRLCDPTGRHASRDVPLLGADGTAALAASADGQTLYRATPEGDVELVRLDGAAGSRFHAQDTRIVAMAVTADGHVLTVGQDGTVRGFDGRGGQFSISVLRGQGRGCDAESLRSAAFSADGNQALVGTTTGGPDCDDARTTASLRLFDLPGGQVRWELRPAQVTAGLFSPDGSVLVTASAHAGDRSDPLPTTLVRLDARNGAPAAAAPGHRAQVTSLRFSPDGAQLASGDAAGTWKIWDVASRTERLSMPLGSGAVVDLRFTPQGDVLLTQHEDDSVRSWRVADGRAGQLLVPPPSPDPVQSAPACAADRAKVAELMRPQPEGPLGVRDPTAWAGLQPLPELVVSSDGENVLAPVAEESCVSLLRSGCSIGCSRRYHLERVAVRTGRRLQTLAVDGELLGGCVPPGGAFVTRGERGGIQVRDSEGEPLARAGAKLGRIAACDATPDGKRMLLASSRLLAFWEAGRPSLRDAVSRRARAPGPVALSPRGEVSVDADGPELRLRSWPSGAIAGRLTLGLQDDAPTATVFSPDGRLLAVGTARGVVHLIRIGGPAATARRP